MEEVGRRLDVEDEVVGLPVDWEVGRHDEVVRTRENWGHGVYLDTLLPVVNHQSGPTQSGTSRVRGVQGPRS